MLAVLLIGLNFFRTQLVLVAIVLAYVICLTAFLGFHEQVPDLIFFVRQQAVYAITLGTLVIVPAIHNERKSRRILIVASKSIHRGQYLAGLLVGAVLIAGIFCLAVGLSAYWMAREASLPVNGLLELILVLFFACAAGSSVGLFCSVLMHPFLGAAATGVILFLPFAAELKGWYLPGEFFPVSAMLRVVLNFTFQKPGTGLWSIGAESLIQAVIFWMAASLAFARRDVTVAGE
jgi:ABC-type transport system involved in multi-copper enzyme maturation permease subunit